MFLPLPRDANELRRHHSRSVPTTACTVNPPTCCSLHEAVLTHERGINIVAINKRFCTTFELNNSCRGVQLNIKSSVAAK